MRKRSRDGGPALELAASEIGRPDRKLQVVGQLGRRLAVALAVLAVALDSSWPPVEILAARDELGSGPGRVLDHGRRLGVFVLPAAREGLDERDHREALLVRQLMPRGHRGRAATPRVTVRYRSPSVGSEPEGVVRNLKTPPAKSRGRGREERAAGPLPSPLGPWQPTQRGVIDLAAERSGDRGCDGMLIDCDADDLRLEHLAPGAAVRAELLEVPDQAHQLVRSARRGSSTATRRPLPEALGR